MLDLGSTLIPCSVIGLRVFRDDRVEGSGLFLGIRGSMLFENKWELPCSFPISLYNPPMPPIVASLYNRI